MLHPEGGFVHDQDRSDGGRLSAFHAVALGLSWG